MIFPILLKYRWFSTGKMLLTLLLKPCAFTCFLSGEANPQAYEFTDCRGGYISVPAGRYRTLCVNSDTESVLYRDIDSFETFGAYAPDGVLNVRSSSAPRAEGTSGERIAKSPDLLYTDRLDDVTIELSGDNRAITPLS